MRLENWSSGGRVLTTVLSLMISMLVTSADDEAHSFPMASYYGLSCEYLELAISADDFESSTIQHLSLALTQDDIGSLQSHCLSNAPPLAYDTVMDKMGLFNQVDTPLSFPTLFPSPC